MIPLIEREVVNKRKWVKAEDISDVFALAESVPGAIAINSATFIGHRIAGIRGAIAAMAGILFPTFLIVILLSILFLFFKENEYVEAAFVGIRGAIVALIVFAALKISKTAIFDKTTFGITIFMVIILLLFHIHPVLIIVSGAFLGIIVVKIKEKMGMIVKLEKKHNDLEKLIS